MITITAELTHSEAIALAQFLKRAVFSDYKSRAADEAEAYEMINASTRICEALAEAGFAPR